MLSRDVVVTLQQLRYFLAAVERGSVSGAAEACFVSQPSLSEQLHRLEKSLARAASPEEMADLVWFLAGEDRAGYVTGETFAATGGSAFR